MRLSLDHITVADTTPAQLVEIAAATGCAAICPFLHSMPVLPAMPDYDLVRDSKALRDTRRALSDNGIAVDLIYPFTVAGRTIVSEFAPALEAGAALGAPLANVLCYDRDPVRRNDNLAELAELAARFGLGLAIEFYPPSQVRTLAEAFDQIDAIGRRDIGVTVDLLHLQRGGGMPGALEHLNDPSVRIAQISDGPATVAPDRLEWEAGIQRLLPGEGVFPGTAFLAALPDTVPISVEVPQQSALELGVPPLERAAAAVAAVLRTVPGR
jgi:sugar phosphate isomerase/epimerase